MIKIQKSVSAPKILKGKYANDLRSQMASFYSIKEEKRRQLRGPQSEWPLEFRRELIENLNKDFNGKCCFCERFVPGFDHGLIEHFRPVGSAQGFREFSSNHYWWLFLEWSNLYLSCPECNKNKANWFPVTGERARIKSDQATLLKEHNLIIDPCHEDPAEYLIFMEDDTVISETRKGQVSIDILKLNSTSIVEDRSRAAGEFQKTLTRFDNALAVSTRRKKQAYTLLSLRSDFQVISDVLSLSPKQDHVGVKRQMTHSWFYERRVFKDYFEKNLVSKNFTAAQRSIFSRLIEIYTRGASKNKQKTVDKEREKPRVSMHRAYIQDIEIKNFKSISYLKISFNNPTEVTTGNLQVGTPWLMLLGENGVGKSSVLQAVTYALCGAEYLKKLGPAPSKILKHHTQSGFIKINFTEKDLPPAHVTFSKNKKQLSTNLKSPPTTVLAYGSTRLPEGYGNSLKAEDSNERVRALNMFDSGCALTNSDEWLIGQFNSNREQYDLCAKAIKILIDIDPKIELKSLAGKSKNVAGKKTVVDNVYIEVQKIRDRSFLYVKKDKDKFSLDELSDGYRSVIGLGTDIMKAMITDYQDMNTAAGIVIIDEIGTHLHPRWRMLVVKRLRQTFPNVQFLVTTHDPLCLKGLNEKEVVVLRREENGSIDCVRDLPNPAGFRSDQLLNSEFFGLYSTIDPDVEADFTTYYTLRNLKKRTKDQELLLERSRQNLRNKKLLPSTSGLSAEEPIINLGNSLREELIYEAVDTVLSRQNKKGKTKDRQLLKEETIQEVTKLWDTLEKLEL